MLTKIQHNPPVDDSTPVLSAHSLTVALSSGKNILHNISVSITEGEHIAIIGPNGSGKTTLLRALSGRFHQLYAQLYWQHIPFSALSRIQIAQIIALMSQNEQIEPRLTVSDYVSLGLIPHRHRLDKTRQEEILAEAMQKTGIHPFLHRYLGSLSGGQMQRVMLARAFAQQPKILMLDEPTNHLDPRARHDILSMVTHSQITTIAALHDLTLLPVFADRIIVLHQGQLIAEGSIQETLTDDLLKEVFGIRHFVLIHPETGKDLFVFEPV